MEKPRSWKTVVVVVILALITGTISGLSAGGLIIHRISTFFGVTLFAWVVYGFIAVAMTK